MSRDPEHRIFDIDMQKYLHKRLKDKRHELKVFTNHKVLRVVDWERHPCDLLLVSSDHNENFFGIILIKSKRLSNGCIEDVELLVAMTLQSDTDFQFFFNEESTEDLASFSLTLNQDGDSGGGSRSGGTGNNNLVCEFLHRDDAYEFSGRLLQSKAALQLRRPQQENNFRALQWMCNIQDRLSRHHSHSKRTSYDASKTDTATLTPETHNSASATAEEEHAFADIDDHAFAAWIQHLDTAHASGSGEPSMSPRTALLTERMSERASEYTKTQTLQLVCSVWSLYGLEEPPLSLAGWHDSAFGAWSESPAELVAVALLEGGRHDRWIFALNDELTAAGGAHQLLDYHSAGNVSLMLFVKDELMSSVSGVQMQEMPEKNILNSGDTDGNVIPGPEAECGPEKGVKMSFKLHDTSLTFVANLLESQDLTDGSSGRSSTATQYSSRVSSRFSNSRTSSVSRCGALARSRGVVPAHITVTLSGANCGAHLRVHHEGRLCRPQRRLRPTGGSPPMMFGNGNCGPAAHCTRHFSVGAERRDLRCMKRAFLSVSKGFDQLENALLPRAEVSPREVPLGQHAPNDPILWVRFQRKHINFLTLRNLGAAPLQFRLLPHPNHRRALPAWMQLRPAHGRLPVGRSCQLSLEVRLTERHVAYVLSGRDPFTRINDSQQVEYAEPLILHLTGGGDIFVMPRFKVRPTCFGLPLAALQQLRQPVKSLTPTEVLSAARGETVESANECEIPEELQLLLNFLSRREALQTPNWFRDAGSEQDLCLVRRKLDNREELPAFFNVHAALEALLLLLRSQRVPVIPPESVLAKAMRHSRRHHHHHHRRHHRHHHPTHTNDSNANDPTNNQARRLQQHQWPSTSHQHQQQSCRTWLRTHLAALPPVNRAVIDKLATFMRTAANYSNYHSAPPEVIADIFDSALQNSDTTAHFHCGTSRARSSTASVTDDASRATNSSIPSSDNSLARSSRQTPYQGFSVMRLLLQR